MLGSALVEQSNAFLDRCWNQVHVPLHGRQVCMAGQFLNRPGLAPLHRAMRAEGVTTDMHTAGFNVARRATRRIVLCTRFWVKGCPS